MPTSPSENSGKTTTFEILIDGHAIPDNFQVVSIVTAQSVNRISSATITLVLPLNDSGDDIFSDTDSDDFTPENPLEIKLGYDGKNSPVFNGLISQLGIRNMSRGLTEMVIQCRGHVAKMTLGQSSACYQNMQDSAIIQTIAVEHGMDVEVDSTLDAHTQIAKYGVSDWDFVIGRARANGMLVYEENKKLLVKKPATTDSTTDLKIEYGIDVLHFDLGIDSGNKPATGHKTNPVHGSASFQGFANIKLNSMLEMHGFGKRFNGNALITSIKHKIKEGNWKTIAGLGLPTEWQLESGVDAASNKQPSFSGLQTGTVKQMHADPDGQYRILVDVPEIAPDGVGVWARFAQFYASAGKGSFFLPEVGDEVILGFKSDDLLSPVILGMLYNKNNTPPYLPEQGNPIKAMVTKSNLRLEFNDEDKILTIKTPGGNQFALSDKDKSIRAQDMNGNALEMTTSGINLSSANDILIKSNGKISLQAVSGISAIASGGDVDLRGLNVHARADIAFSANGSATAELSAAGQTTVKGAIVMIN